MIPRLYSISTVCLLKHYNQDYLLHTLRTDFTGSNGVGKSIIADLFQIVFVADAKYVKFATEGIDKKKRKIETLPYDSGIGYVFFNVEVKDLAYVTIGAAIFAQGHQIIKPFIITSALEFEKTKLEQQTITPAQLVFANDFLKPNREAYTLEEMARILPDKSSLYLHYFNSKDERAIYYSWLYHNELLPINLVKDGNLKAYAKVIQSFSKSKSLDIDSSKSLIEYLFEEDEAEINLEYRTQEQSIKELLYQFKTTKDQIHDISSKQADLRKLKDYEDAKNKAAFELDVATYVRAHQDFIKKQSEFDKHESELIQSESRLDILQGRTGILSLSVEEANNSAQREHKTFTDLASKQSLFDKLEKLKADEQVLRAIDTGGLMDEVPPERVTELLEKDSRYYSDNIYGSRDVLKRYNTVSAMARKKAEQDEWLKNKIRFIEEKEVHITKFKNTLQSVEQNNLFVQALLKNSNLSKVQQAVLVHLRDVALNKPSVAREGLRYVDSIDIIDDLQLTKDDLNRGWWLKTGSMFEFVPETSMLLPDLSNIAFNNLDQLKEYIERESENLKEQKDIYLNLQNGIAVDGALEYDFDVDLSDSTKVKNHRLAAQLCAVVNHKIHDLIKQQNLAADEINKVAIQYGISIEGVAYTTLFDEMDRRSAQARKKYEELKEQQNIENGEINTLTATLPLLREKHTRAFAEAEEAKELCENERKVYEARYPQQQLPAVNDHSLASSNILQLQGNFANAAGIYTNEYNQIVGKYSETKDQRDIRINDQIRNQNFAFTILEQTLLGSKIGTLDEVTDHLETLNADLLSIADGLLESLVKVFGKTESYFDKYKALIGDLNDFFKGKLISNRFYFRIEFEQAPKLDIKWIEYLRKSASGIAASRVSVDVSPEQFIVDFYMQYSGNRSKVDISDLLNPKRYFVLKGRLTDKHGRDIPGSTGESYTAIALLGIARLSIVQDGNRAGLRFIILEESATLDNVNFSLFPLIAKEYGYQIITMTPKPYAVGDDNGWYIHQLIPGKDNEDINYPKTMSYFRTNKSQMELANYLKARANELAIL